MPEKICPMCGRSSREVPFIGNLCADCFVKRYGVAYVPRSVEFVYCRSCFAHKDQGRWSDPYESLDESLIDYLTSKLAAKIKPVPPIEEVEISSVRIERMEGGTVARVRLEGHYGEVRVSDEVLITVQERAGLCPICASRKTGSGYRAVVQLRAYPTPLSKSPSLRSDVERVVRSMGDEVVKVEDVKEGIDVYMRDVQAARSLAMRLRSQWKAKVVETVKGGGRSAKLYVSVRLASIVPGDVIEFRGRPALYLADSHNGVLLVDLDTGHKFTAGVDELWAEGFKPYAGERLRRLMVVSRTGSSTVLSDGTPNFVEVPNSQVESFVDEVKEGQEFLVYLSNRRIYLIKRVG